MESLSLSSERGLKTLEGVRTVNHAFSLRGTCCEFVTKQGTELWLSDREQPDAGYA